MTEGQAIPPQNSERNMPEGWAGFKPALGAFRPVLARGTGRDSLGRNAESGAIAAHGVGAPLDERQVVFPRAAFVGMTFDRDRDLRLELQQGSVFLQSRLCLRRQVLTVERETHAVGQLLGERLHRVLADRGRPAAGGQQDQRQRCRRCDNRAARCEANVRHVFPQGEAATTTRRCHDD